MNIKLVDNWIEWKSIRESGKILLDFSGWFLV